MSDVAAPDAAIIALAKTVAVNARAVSFASKQSYSCTIIVETDDEKGSINANEQLLASMKEAAGIAGRIPDYLTAESKETVDRRWHGDWNQVFR